jgi:hypothetical protein
MTDRPATDDEVLAMVLYTGMHLDRVMAMEAARRVAAMWGRPVHVQPVSPAVAVYALIDSDPGAGPELAGS